MRAHPRSVLQPAGLIVAGLLSLSGCMSGGITTTTGESAPDTLAVFKSGEARLTCIVSCGYAWGAAGQHVKSLYTNGLWVDLVNEVTRIGHDDDLSYFYLGQAAERLGYEEAAKTYYKLALSPKLKCAGFINVCNGFDVPRLVNKSLAQMQNSRKTTAEKHDANPTNKTSSVELTTASPKKETISAAASTAENGTNSNAPGEVPPISVSMWMQILPPRNDELTSDWLLETMDTLGSESKALRLSKKYSEALIKSVQSTMLSEYYIEIENFHDAPEFKARLAKNLESLNILGITRSFYDESFKNLKIAIPEGTIRSSHHVNGSVFGKALGSRFSVPECKKNKYGVGYNIDPKTTCFEHVASSDTNPNEFTGYVRVLSAYDEIPDVVHGIYYYALLINGKLEGIYFDTGGIKNMDFVYGKLQGKYGVPSTKNLRIVKNIYGATFDVTNAQWTTDNTIITFLGATGTIDSGSVRIFTKNGLMYDRAQEKNANKENSL
ncbi:hypothetical protein [Pseudomonas sp.]|uniref:hypothetical protein n=1 Tax=Pseudomonas sp. TaxID=306 RepID=UPI0027331D9F|nr:hypothetical protein [Pseudomonas sp.]MDP3815720.1 hypothetical protein [Pseudomonas sp.]